MKQFICELTQLPELHMDYSHNYTINGKTYSSVTRMLSATKSPEEIESIAHWRDKIGEAVADYIFRTSGKIGTETHQLNENYLNGTQNGIVSLLSKAHHTNFIPYLDKIEKIYGIESRLYSESLGIAGTTDCVGLYDGKYSIIDYKTKRSEQKLEWLTDYFIQCTAYSIMWEELTGNTIEQLVILVSSESGSMQEFTGIPIHYKDKLSTRIKLYKEITSFN